MKNKLQLNFLIGLFLLSLCSFGIFKSETIYAASLAEYQNIVQVGYDSMPNRLPKDGNDGNRGDSQYITVSGLDEINDVKGGSDGHGDYNYSFLTIYSNSKTPKPLNITFISRAVYTVGDISDCTTTLNLYYRSEPINSMPAVTPNATVSTQGDTCGNPRQVSNPFPESALKEIILQDPNGQLIPTGIYKGYIAIKTQNNRQASFKIGSRDNGARFGYQGGKWINMYPSALDSTNGYNIYFKWRPPCTEYGNQFVRFDDGNEGNYQGRDRIIQPESWGANVNISKYRPPDGNRTTVIPEESVTFKDWNLPIDHYGPGNRQTYAYQAVFNNIRGGNGIGFMMPYDSGDSYIECPPSINGSWILGNYPSYRDKATVAVTIDTVTKPTTAEPNRPITEPTSPNYSYPMDCAGRYPASSDRNSRINRCNWLNYDNAKSTNSQRVKDALKTVSFWHVVYNKNSYPSELHSIAPNNGHNTKIQYMFDLGGGRGSTGYRDRYGGMSVSTNISPGSNWQPFAIDSPTTNSTSSIAQEMFENPQYGDRYCERALTYNFPTSKGGNPIHSGGICVTLQSNTQVCNPSWSINVDGGIEKDGNNIGKILDNGLVGEAYNYYAYSYNNGPGQAETNLYVGNNINNLWGGWDPRALSIGDNVFEKTLLATHSVSRSEGGQSIPVQFKFNPTYYDNSSCSGGGEAPIDLSINVPYYYHLIVSSSGGNAQIQQGESVNIKNASITNPDSSSDSRLMNGDDQNPGRKHTKNRGGNWAYVAFTTTDINDTKNRLFNNKQMGQYSGLGACNALQNSGITGFGGCNQFDTGNYGDHASNYTTNLPDRAYNIGLQPVGTEICVTLGVNQPTQNTDENTWRFSQPQCTTVIKSPKVQFKYGDVNTGRPRIGVGECQTNPNARIETTGAPNVALVEPNPLERHKYGSWGEYGVFSSGSIIAFGSSGAEAGTTDKAKRLTFGNDTSGYGAYAHNIKCIPNLMNGFSAQDTISSNTIYPNEYFKEAGRDTKSRFQKTGDINLAQRPVDKYKVKVSIVGSGDWGNDIPLNQGGELSPPKIKVRLDLKDSSISRTKTVDIPSQDRNNTTPTEIWFDENELPTDGWKGVGNVSVKFDNNNANWYWDNMRPQMRDRNLYISTMQVQWYKNEVEIANTGAKLATQLNKVDGIDYIRDDPVRCTQREGNPASWQWWENNVSFDEKILAFPPSESDARIGRGGGSCFGIHMDANTLAGYDGRFNQQYPPSPVLSSEYDGFNGRNIILYAQKKQAGDCGAGGVEGNLYINLDILYKISGYNNLSQIPRFTLMADCNIIIADNVQNVRASLIAGNAIQTCSNIAKSQNVCNKPLTITGAIQAKKLLLYRTSGADLTSAGDAKTPAESFEYGVDQMMAGYEYGLVNPVLKPVYQRDLPPRY